MSLDRPLRRRERFRMELPMDDDLIFEVLRFVYRGMMYFPNAFRPRYGQWLKIIDKLGIEDMADRIKRGHGQGSSLFWSNTSSSSSSNSSSSSTDGLSEKGGLGRRGRKQRVGSILQEAGMQHWFQDLPREELLALLCDFVNNNDGAGRAATVGVGFRLRRSFVRILTLLRPHDMTMEVLGLWLYQQLTLLSSRVSLPLAAVAINGSGDKAANFDRNLTLTIRDDEVDLYSQCLLPTVVAYVDLAMNGGIRTTNLYRSDHPALGLSDHSLTSRHRHTARSDSQLWHGGRPVDDSYTTLASMRRGQPPDRTVVVFHVPNDAHGVLDMTLRAAMRRPEDVARRCCQAAQRLVQRALDLADKMADSSGETSVAGATDHVFNRTSTMVTYRHPHELKEDIVLCRNSTLQIGAPVSFAVESLRPHGSAACCGVGVGWILREKPDGLQISTGEPGAIGHFSAAWSSLLGLTLELSAPDWHSFEVRFESRPLGFSWAVAGNSIEVVDVHAEGLARSAGVLKGMILLSLRFLNSEPVKDVASLKKALRGVQVPAITVFGWRRERRIVKVSSLVGLSFKECHSFAAEKEDTVAGTLTERVGRSVLIDAVPPGHPASHVGLGPGWQLRRMFFERKLTSTFTSLDQLPWQLRNPEVVLGFIPPPLLQTLLPVDEASDSNAWPPRNWMSPHLHECLEDELPWTHIERKEVGPLALFQALVPDNRRQVGHALTSDEITPITLNVLVLGQVLPAGLLARWRLGLATESDGIAYDLLCALREVPRDTLQEQAFVAAIVQLVRRAPRDTSINTPNFDEDGWLGGIIIGGSVAHILLRLSNFITCAPPSQPLFDND
eukprot:TRINITY_DN14350_c0_g1_i2.p1 TRINITY_DN14350_c0_g1~~TRINITY_DN14350_c0_g1_i2.p1  ORF type:complete len:959 (+),score=78.48 TRINITY_DN14350_c0_g1_i2:363-2879(+)